MEKKRVLIIDDDADIRFMLKYILAAKGFDVESASELIQRLLRIQISLS
jgi:DNA-binding response OmpR family regulator